MGGGGGGGWAGWGGVGGVGGVGGWAGGGGVGWGGGWGGGGGGGGGTKHNVQSPWIESSTRKNSCVSRDHPILSKIQHIVLYGIPRSQKLLNNLIIHILNVKGFRN